MQVEVKKLKWLARWHKLSNFVCLDGSAPAYYLDRGFRERINNWLIQFEVCLVCPFLQTGINNKSSPITNSRKHYFHYFVFPRLTNVRYEDKYKHVGDVSSKLTTEEATFRVI
ncbi:hypothetical protein AAHE18_14G241000 [Arachis hypogaea]